MSKKDAFSNDKNFYIFVVTLLYSVLSSFILPFMESSKSNGRISSTAIMLVAGPLLICCFFTVANISRIVRYQKHNSFSEHAIKALVVSGFNLVIVIVMKLLTFEWSSYSIIKFGGPLLALVILIAMIICQSSSLRHLLYKDSNLLYLFVMAFIGDLSFYLWQGIAIYNMYHVS